MRRLRAACETVCTELIIVQSAGDADGVVSAMPSVELVTLGPDALAPELWAEGFRRSRGRVVAFTTAHCLATRGWGRSLVDAVDEGAAGAGGPMIPAPGTTALDWAVFYLRYSAFMPSTLGAGRISTEIAGDNAAYSRERLQAHATAMATGFWEVEIHKLLRAEGYWLTAVPEAVMEFGPSFGFGTIATHRFRHGVQFGASRVRAGRNWMLQAAAAPVVPIVLAARAACRLRRTSDIARFSAALPFFLALASCWAAGEAWGGFQARSSDEMLESKRLGAREGVPTGDALSRLAEKSGDKW